MSQRRSERVEYPLTLASTVPNTVTPLPDDDAVLPLPALGVPAPDAQPDTSTPIVIANTAAMIDFTGNSREMVGLHSL